MALEIPSIPLAYASARDEYAALRSGAALDRVAVRRLVELDAARRDQLRPLRGRAGAEDLACAAAVVVDDDERLMAVASRIRLGDHRVLLDLSNRGGAPVLERGGAEIHDQTAEIVRIRLRGPEAAAALEAVTGGAPGYPGAVRVDGDVGGLPLVVACTAPHRFALYCDRPHALPVWHALVGGGCVPVGSAALETVRIEDAEPCLERDFRGPPPLAPAGFGAFAAAEPAPGRRLVLAEHEGATPVERATVRRDGADVGDVRAAAPSPQRAGRPVAFLLVPAEHAAPATELELHTGSRAFAARVVRTVEQPPNCEAPVL
jgi:glycine cleavage system aminomethyltransferase T